MYAVLVKWVMIEDRFVFLRPSFRRTQRHMDHDTPGFGTSAWFQHDGARATCQTTSERERTRNAGSAIGGVGRVRGQVRRRQQSAQLLGRHVAGCMRARARARAQRQT